MFPCRIAGARTMSIPRSLPCTKPNASMGAKSFGEPTISEPTTPESGAINSDQGYDNMEAHSTPQPPNPGMKFGSLKNVVSTTGFKRGGMIFG